MDQSILDSIKKLLGIDSDYEAFDTDIVIHINTAFGTLHQLGVGPADAFEIEDKTATWDQFIANDKRLNATRTYVYLKVRSFFDPPTSSFALTALNEQTREFEFRLGVAAESDALAIKFPDVPPPIEVVEPVW